MPIISDKELPPDKLALWKKALSAVELRNYGYAISLIGNVVNCLLYTSDAADE